MAYQGDATKCRVPVSASAPVRCPACNSVVFCLLFGMGDGVCCGRRITAVRETLNHEVRIVGVDRPVKKLKAAVPDSSR